MSAVQNCFCSGSRRYPTCNEAYGCTFVFRNSIQQKLLESVEMISEQHTGDGLTTLLEKRVFGDWDPEQDALVKRRGTPAGDRREQCIHDIFDEQASRTPNAVAVQYAGEYLTYDELRWRAN